MIRKTHYFGHWLFGEGERRKGLCHMLGGRKGAEKPKKADKNWVNKS